MMRARARRTAEVAAALAAGLLISLLLPLPNAAGADETAAQTMRDLYESSGLRSQVASTAELVSQGLAQQPGRIAPETLDAARRAVQRAYDAGALEAALLANLASRYDAGHAASSLAWLRSPLGQRIARLEGASATSDGVRRMQQFALGLENDPPSPQRQALERRFEAVLKTAESMLELTMATSLGLAIALDTTHPADRRAGPDEMRAEVEARRAWLQPMLRRVAMVGFFFTYRELSDDEIETYIGFAESEAGRWYRDVLMGSFLDAVSTASRAIGGRPESGL
jgi:hypothetical protein